MIELIDIDTNNTNNTKLCIHKCFYKTGNRISTKNCIYYCRNNNYNVKNKAEINIKFLIIVMLIILIKKILF